MKLLKNARRWLRKFYHPIYVGGAVYHDTKTDTWHKLWREKKTLYQIEKEIKKYHKEHPPTTSTESTT